MQHINDVIRMNSIFHLIFQTHNIIEDKRQGDRIFVSDFVSFVLWEEKKTKVQ